MQMTLDHFSSPISHVLYQCFGFFSAAEGFFFLSGFVGMLATISKTARGETTRWMQKRAFRIWIYHIVSLLFLVSAALFFFPRIQHFFCSTLRASFSRRRTFCRSRSHSRMVRCSPALCHSSRPSFFYFSADASRTFSANVGNFFRPLDTRPISSPRIHSANFPRLDLPRIL